MKFPLLATHQNNNPGMYFNHFLPLGSDTLVSGPEVFLIACGRAAFLIMSLSISPYESHYFANEYHYHTILYHMTILRMRSRNNEIEIQE